MRTNRPPNGRLALAVVLNLAIGGIAWAADANASKPRGEPSAPARHAHLGCSFEQADALYGKPTQQKQLFKGTKEGTKEQRFYKSPQGKIVEIWFGAKGAEAILLPGENRLEVIYQVLRDSAEGGTWVLDGRVWRRSDGQAVAAVMQGKALFVGSAPWLIKMVEDEAVKPK